MPEISRFLGIVIAMYYRDHSPPHFHASYGEKEMRVRIDTGEVLSGNLPPRTRKHVLEWWEIHKEELELNWELAQNRKPLKNIEPLE